jgi:hypothetical protein
MSNVALVAVDEDGNVALVTGDDDGNVDNGNGIGNGNLACALAVGEGHSSNARSTRSKGSGAEEPNRLEIITRNCLYCSGLGSSNV